MSFRMPAGGAGSSASSTSSSTEVGPAGGRGLGLGRAGPAPVPPPTAAAAVEGLGRLVLDEGRGTAGGAATEKMASLDPLDALAADSRGRVMVIKGWAVRGLDGTRSIFFVVINVHLD
eukprot:CAMPEP_0206492680 /NCGR_PEP_ID=MMETSP0324_2-20121206/46291_1 /ASSEMBLY_ACC=CAM_ASM_000836 /TAXON_ID=2866 /ORGANISM="Crypthecodinium cohnii, Strain Seligo" /LENGTH=117 /DNA_ID=CAMNT_0053975219 /DNA_START=206 /DNA_END=559 /DNA_ORIENTATION=+